MKKAIVFAAMLLVISNISALNLQEVIDISFITSRPGKIANINKNSSILKLKNLEEKTEVQADLSPKYSSDFSKEQSSFSLGTKIQIPTSLTYKDNYKPVLDFGLGAIIDHNEPKNTIYLPNLGLSSRFDFNNNEREIDDINKMKARREIQLSDSGFKKDFTSNFLKKLSQLISDEKNVLELSLRLEKTKNSFNDSILREGWSKNSLTYIQKDYEIQELQYNYDNAKETYEKKLAQFENLYLVDPSMIEFKKAIKFKADYKKEDDSLFNYDLKSRELELQNLKSNPLLLDVGLLYSGSYQNDRKKANLDSSSLSFNTNLIDKNFSINANLNLPIQNDKVSPSLSIGATINLTSKSNDSLIEQKENQINQLNNQYQINKILELEKQMAFEQVVDSYNKMIDAFEFKSKLHERKLLDAKKSFELGIISEREYKSIEEEGQLLAFEEKLLSINLANLENENESK